MAERAGIEPATAGFIRLLLVLKTRWDTGPVLSKKVVKANLGFIFVKNGIEHLWIKNNWRRFGHLL